VFNKNRTIGFEWILCNVAGQVHDVTTWQFDIGNNNLTHCGTFVSANLWAWVEVATFDRSGTRL